MRGPYGSCRAQKNQISYARRRYEIVRLKRICLATKCGQSECCQWMGRRDTHNRGSCHNRDRAIIEVRQTYLLQNIYSTITAVYITYIQLISESLLRSRREAGTCERETRFVYYTSIYPGHRDSRGYSTFFLELPRQYFSIPYVHFATCVHHNGVLSVAGNFQLRPYTH